MKTAAGAPAYTLCCLCHAEEYTPVYTLHLLIELTITVDRILDYNHNLQAKLSHSDDVQHKINMDVKIFSDNYLEYVKFYTLQAQIYCQTTQTFNSFKAYQILCFLLQVQDECSVK